jgi:hypothetical protein
MGKGEQKGNRESKKPKKEKIKTIAAAPSQRPPDGSRASALEKRNSWWLASALMSYWAPHLRLMSTIRTSRPGKSVAKGQLS